MEKTNAIIIGAGGLGREIAATLENYFSNQLQLIGFIDDGLKPGTFVNGIAVMGGLEDIKTISPNPSVFLGIGNPKVKQAILGKLLKEMKLNGENFPNIIHPFARLHQPEFIKMGYGNYIADSVILTTNVEIGNFNLINLMSTIGHDASIGDYCSIMPGVNISGGAHLKDLTYVGTGAKLIKSSIIGKGSTIGAGAVVNQDIGENETWVGVPARIIKQI